MKNQDEIGKDTFDDAGAAAVAAFAAFAASCVFATPAESHHR